MADAPKVRTLRRQAPPGGDFNVASANKDDGAGTPLPTLERVLADTLRVESLTQLFDNRDTTGAEEESLTLNVDFYIQARLVVEYHAASGDRDLIVALQDYANTWHWILGLTPDNTGLQQDLIGSGTYKAIVLDRIDVRGMKTLKLWLTDRGEGVGVSAWAGAS